MRTLILTTLIALSTGSLLAQDVYKTIAQETCDCISKRGLDMTKRKEVEMALGLCMMESAQNNNLELDLTDEDAMEKLGEKVGLQMASICPNVFTAFVGDEDESENAGVSVTGKIKSIEEGDFLFINLKEESGKEHKLMWLRYFPGSDDFQSEPKKLVGKNVTITYQNIECYLPKAKVYYNNKEIINLELN